MNTATFPRNPRGNDEHPHAAALAKVESQKAKDAIDGLPGQPAWALANMLRAWGFFFPGEPEFEDAPIVQRAIRVEMKRRNQKKGRA